MQLVVRQKYNWLAHGNTIGCYSKIQFVVSRKYNWLTVLNNNLTILGDVNTSKYKQVHAMMGILPLVCNCFWAMCMHVDLIFAVMFKHIVKSEKK